MKLHDHTHQPSHPFFLTVRPELVSKHPYLSARLHKRHLPLTTPMSFSNTKQYHFLHISFKLMYMLVSFFGDKFFPMSLFTHLNKNGQRTLWRAPVTFLLFLSFSSSSSSSSSSLFLIVDIIMQDTTQVCVFGKNLQTGKMNSSLSEFWRQVLVMKRWPWEIKLCTIWDDGVNIIDVMDFVNNFLKVNLSIR